MPTVISTADGTLGAAPLIHQRCVVLKVHGDYLDDRIKNTEDELSSYDPALNLYLDRIFDEFGLIVCGWSGDWDPALRAAIERCPSRRYTTFWTLRGKPSAKAGKLITLRGAAVAEIASADAFFEGIADKVASLEEVAAPSLLSVGAAIASVKRYASDPAHRIRLHDLLLGESAAVNARTLAAPVTGFQIDDEYIKGRFASYDTSTEVLRAALYTASFWAEPHHHDAVKRTIAALVPGDGGNGYTALLQLRIYPAVVAFYAAALGALDGQRHHLFKELTRLTVGSGRRTKAALPDLTAGGSIEKRLAEHSEENRWYFPLSEHFRRRLFPTSDNENSDDTNHFDRLEVMLALTYLDQAYTGEMAPNWMPYGRFAARHGDSAYNAVFEEAEREGEAWGPLKAGMFSGKMDRFETVKMVFTAALEKNANRW